MKYSFFLIFFKFIAVTTSLLLLYLCLYNYFNIIILINYNFWISNLINLSFFIILFKSFIIFLFIVLVRVLVPRFKIESLTKLGWSYSLIFVLINFIFFSIGFFF